MSPRIWGSDGERWGSAGKVSSLEKDWGTGRNDRKAWTVAQLEFTVSICSNPFSRSSVRDKPPVRRGLFFGLHFMGASLLRRGTNEANPAMSHEIRRLTPWLHAA